VYRLAVAAHPTCSPLVLGEQIGYELPMAGLGR
jgi:hypothetical protein